MMNDEELRWGDVALDSQRERLIKATLQALKDAPARLLELEAQSVKIRETDESMPYPGPKKIISYWLTRDGLVQKIVTGRRHEHKESQPISSEHLLVDVITQQQISAPDIRSAFKEAEKKHDVIAALRALVAMPQVSEMSRSISLSSNYDPSRDRSLYLDDQGLRQGYGTRISAEELTLELVRVSKADIERIKKAKKSLEA